MASKMHDTSRSEISLAVRCGFGWLMFFTEVLLFGALGLCIFWIWNYGGGVAWSNDAAKQMNLHYLLMLGGMIFLNGQSMLVYRSFPCCKAIYNKVIHTILFVLSISSVTIGIVSVIQVKETRTDASHFYSLHSWIGLGAMGLFALQFVVGFISFLVLLCCDTATAKFRQRLLPTHVIFGLTVFTLAVAACVTGLTQVASRMGDEYRNFSERSIVLNVLGASLIALVILLPYLIHNNSFKRYTTLTIN